ncbi:hypothetical protein R6Q57_030071 [Mikania cordata]
MAQPEIGLEVVVDSPTNIENIPTTIKNPQQRNIDDIIAKINAGYFRICISLGAQALLWKTLITQKSPTFDNNQLLLFTKLPSITFFLVWCLALCIFLSISILYILRCIFHFKMVKAEYHHHIGVNYLFAPWVSCLLLLQSAPAFIFQNKRSHYEYMIWWPLIIPVIALDVKIYGQWFTTDKRFLSMAANPTSQLSVIGNLVGSHAAIQMGWTESGICLFTLGMTHYLASRPVLFKKSVKNFSVAWWAFSFPLSFLALASMAYAQEANRVIATCLALVLSATSVLVFVLLLVYSTLKIDSLLRKPILSF